MHSMVSYNEKGPKRNVKGRGMQRVEIGFFREREILLSKIPGNRIMGFLRAKKESCSTRRGLRVDFDFEEFGQTP